MGIVGLFEVRLGTRGRRGFVVVRTDVLTLKIEIRWDPSSRRFAPILWPKLDGRRPLVRFPGIGLA